ncbi:phosphocholine-specific phospholipase C [Pelomonas sp. KK5]|uniref:phosphocholine-specific phospholipase C n=1 Tax=Pelomonas sp. KK5 TaxID=1855730 RepID=UPI00097C3585|nr:phospholipase C, phosphocholine-specific [Pelomonas sp. KK5]
MTAIDRRAVLRGLAGLGASAALPDSIQKALAIPAAGATGTIEDVKHIVVLMQENRSFDHYFGMLRGVRGFGDPRAAKRYGGAGATVFEQPNLNSQGVTQSPATILPYHPTAANLGQQFLTGLPHAWADAHSAWNSGRNDRWVPAKGKQTMAYLQRADIPFYYALADAFTICDAYHCSIMASTDPNRYYLWSGWCGQNGTAAGGIDVANTGSTPGSLTLNSSGGNAGNGTPPFGPVVNNAEAGYGWTTYPERLQKAGVSWKIYQDIGHGLNAAGSWGWDSVNPYIGNYGDNSLLYFKQYQNAQPGDPLYDRARTGTNLLNGGAWNNGTLFDQLRADVLNNTLPQVSWIAAPEAYSEHSNWPTSYGVWYIQNVLNALTANPSVWASTVFIICFDENDGFFDHVVAPTPPASSAQGLSTVSTVNEIYPGAGSYAAGPYGLGARVPMLVISPWSKGGWVNSQVFDHTSIVRFIEKRFGIAEPNISPWRRAVCGDLSTTLDFSLPNTAAARLPSTAAYAAPQADIVAGKKYSSYVPAVPASQALPVQEPGQRLSRALPYELQVDWQPNADKRSFTLAFTNTGTAGAWLQVRSATLDTQAGGSTGPWGYTVEPGKSLTDTWTAPTVTSYDLAVHGPNGFYRAFAGSLDDGAAKLACRTIYDRASGGVSLVVSNVGTTAAMVTVTDRYTQAASHQLVAPGASFRSDWALAGSSRWYDLVVGADGDSRFLAQFAGRVETGVDGLTDPHV